MTRKRLAPARWTLPDIVDPPDSVCFEIQVPNDKFHIAAFLGAIYDLSKPYKWANDDAHTAILVGAVWQEIFLALRRNNCHIDGLGVGVDGDPDYMLRQSPTNPCILESSVDGTTWCTWADLSLCLKANPGQPGPGGPGPEPGSAEEHCLKLSGNGQVILPIPVSEGDVITVGDADGGWNDGTSSWFCPDGSSYIGGLCVPFSGHDGGDPSAVANHMSIVALIAGVWYPTDSPIVVAAGLTDESVIFQANDGTLSDNYGDIQFCATVQNQSPETFTHHFDFRTGLHGWTIRTLDASAPLPTYVPGTGIVGTNPSGSMGQGIIEIGLDMPRSWPALHVRYAGTNVDDGGGVHGIYNMVSPLQWNSNIESFVTHTGPAVDFSCDFTLTAQAVKLNMNLSTPGAYEHTITDCWITAPGTDPFVL